VPRGQPSYSVQGAADAVVALGGRQLASAAAGRVGRQKIAAGRRQRQHRRLRAPPARHVEGGSPAGVTTVEVAGVRLQPPAQALDVADFGRLVQR
jgi:hypothetical protein